MLRRERRQRPSVKEEEHSNRLVRGTSVRVCPYNSSGIHKPVEGHLRLEYFVSEFYGQLIRATSRRVTALTLRDRLAFDRTVRISLRKEFISDSDFAAGRSAICLDSATGHIDQGIHSERQPTHCLKVDTEADTEARN